MNVHTGGFSSPLLFYSHFFASRSLLLLFSSLVLSLFFHVSFSFSSSLFSFLFSPLSSLSSSLSAHTETRSDRQVTLPTKNGHAPREREPSTCQSLLCHILGSFRVLSQIKPQAPLFVGLIFMFNVLSALTGFRPRLSQEILCIAKLMTANCSAECPTQHMRRICSMSHIHNTCNIHCLLSFLLDENILK